MLSASIKVRTPRVYVQPRYRDLRTDDGKNIIAGINHGRTSGGVRMYLGLSGLDYTSSRWALVGFREFYNGDTCENFWSTRHGYLRSTLANVWKAVLIDAGTPIGMA